MRGPVQTSEYVIRNSVGARPRPPSEGRSGVRVGSDLGAVEAATTDRLEQVLDLGQVEAQAASEHRDAAVRRLGLPRVVGQVHGHGDHWVLVVQMSWPPKPGNKASLAHSLDMYQARTLPSAQSCMSSSSSSSS